MKLPVTISLLLCLALYAIQVVTPCGSCMDISVPTSCNHICSDEGCDAPSEGTEECPCSMENSILSVENNKAFTAAPKTQLVETQSWSIDLKGQFKEMLFHSSPAPPPPTAGQIRLINQSLTL